MRYSAGRELDQILLHELSHLRNCDNFIGTPCRRRCLIDSTVDSAVLFFHPAVWLCGHALRREAETGVRRPSGVRKWPFRSICARPHERRRTGSIESPFDKENPGNELFFRNGV